MNDEHQHSSVRFIVRYYPELLTLLAVGFILQTGLIPFDISFATRQVGDAFSLSVNAPFPDIISNVFLYVPLGALLFWVARRRCISFFAAALTTVVIISALSAAIEYTQFYSPSRVSSAVDWICNSLGGLVGICVSSVASALVPRMLGATLVELGAHPRLAMVKVYCVALVVIAAMPFSFSFDVARFGHAAKSAVYVPFGALDAATAESSKATDSDNGRWFSFIKWSQFKHFSRWAGEFASFALLAWLLYSSLSTSYEFRARASATLVMWCGFGLACLLSVLQFPIMSRGFDVTDILFRVMGLVGGLLSWHLVRRAIMRHENPWPGFAKTGCMVVVLYIVYTGILPLNFGADGSQGVSVSLASTSFLPFRAYFETRFDVMIDDILEKLTAYAMFGAMLCVAWRRMAHASPMRRAVAVSMVGVALSIPIECAQMFLPVRIVSLTDLILAAVGSSMGALFCDQAIAFYRFAVHYRGRTARDLAAGLASGDLSLTDRLIATLMEPREDAPKEPSPGHRRVFPR